MPHGSSATQTRKATGGPERVPVRSPWACCVSNRKAQCCLRLRVRASVRMAEQRACWALIAMYVRSVRVLLFEKQGTGKKRGHLNVALSAVSLLSILHVYYDNVQRLCLKRHAEQDFASSAARNHRCAAAL